MVLSDGSGSPFVPVTVTDPASAPVAPASTVKTSASSERSPTAMPADVHRTPDSDEQDHPTGTWRARTPCGPGATPTNVRPTGTSTSSVSSPLGSGPSLSTVTVHVTVSPGDGAGADTETDAVEVGGPRGGGDRGGILGAIVGVVRIGGGGSHRRRVDDRIDADLRRPGHRDLDGQRWARPDCQTSSERAAHRRGCRLAARPTRSGGADECQPVRQAVGHDHGLRDVRAAVGDLDRVVPARSRLEVSLVMFDDRQICHGIRRRVGHTDRCGGLGARVVVVAHRHRDRGSTRRRVHVRQHESGAVERQRFRSGAASPVDGRRPLVGAGIGERPAACERLPGLQGGVGDRRHRRRDVGAGDGGPRSSRAPRRRRRPGARSTGPRRLVQANDTSVVAASSYTPPPSRSHP